MTRKQFLQLPANPIDETTPTICVSFEIPNDPNIRANVLGEIWRLGQWYSYQRDNAQTARHTAEIVRQHLARSLKMCACGLDCDSVSECIENSVSTRSALKAWFDATYPAVINSGSEEYIADRYTQGEAVPACDINQLWGSVRAIQINLHGNNLDFIERIETDTNTIELLGIIGDNVFALAVALGSTAIAIASLVGEVVTAIQDNIGEMYVSAYTDEVADEIACAYFCLSRRHCRYELASFEAYHTSKLNNVQPLESLQAILEAIAGSYSAVEVVHMMYAVQLALLRIANNFIIRLVSDALPIGKNDIDRLYRVAMSAEPSDAWEVLCTSCDTTLLAWRYQLPQTPLVPPSGWTWTTNGNIHVPTPSPSYETGYYIYVGGPTTKTASMTSTLTKPSGYVSTIRLKMRVNDTSPVTASTTVTASNGGNPVSVQVITLTKTQYNREVELTINAPIDEIKIEQTARQTYSGVWLEKVEVKG